MVMTLEQALTYPGELLAVWDRGVREEHLMLCSVADGKLAIMAAGEMSRPEAETWMATLRGRGVRQGATSGVAPYTWSNDGAFTVWSLVETVVDTHDGAIETAAGSRLARADAVRVVSFVDEDSLGHRGVKVITRDGEVLIAEEDDPAAELDPAYGFDNVLIDGAWAVDLGRDLATWLGVPHVDELVSTPTTVRSR